MFNKTLGKKKRSNENISILFVAVVDELDFPFLLRDCFFANDAVTTNFSLLLFHGRTKANWINVPTTNINEAMR